ncbi:P-loop NTPase [Janibacter cremeus]|uniref:P-loop NTPase n=1 Tax=Janibacter cremeus TaxID=1285192 RepID=UPI0023F9F863|nr:P-loop NTPase [Janibacter cremeus]WEV77354.1 P-loop NTPase [Janibacter cremeus]
MTSVIIGTPDPNLASDLSGILDEQGDYEVEAITETTDALLERSRRLNPMVVLVDENLGPQPTSVIVGELSRRSPGTSVLVISAIRTHEKTIQVMSAGARGVIGYPFAYEDVATHLDTAIGWAISMRSVLEGVEVTAGRRGKVVAVVGAKGGVGTTTVATHMALDHLMENPDARVCVVDADVEKGDVSALLEVRQAVSIANVARVSDDMTAQTVRDALVHHETGLYMMLAPVDVREAEYVTPDALRAIIELLRRDFDLVVVDGGGHVSPTQAAVVEAAGTTLVVTTADVLAVRAMRKRMQAWEALGVTDEASCMILVNQVDKGSLFPSSAVAKLTTASVLGTTIPLSPRVLEQAINDRDPRSVTESGWWRLIRAIRSDLALSDAGSRTTPADPSVKPEGGRRRRKERKATAVGTEPTPAVAEAAESNAENDTPPGEMVASSSTGSVATSRRERGAVALENAAMTPLALVLAVFGWQLAVTGLTFIYTGHASGAATREWAITSDVHDARAEARDAVPEPFRSGLDVSAHAESVTVNMSIPASFDVPGLPQQLSVTEGVVMEP